MSTAGLDASGTFLVALARALHEAGAPAHRLEDTVHLAARALGVEFDCLSQPTSLILGIGAQTRVLRVYPRDLHLARLTALDAVGTEVARGTVTPEAALARIETIVSAPERLPWWSMLVAMTVSSGCAAVILHGALTTVLASLGLGLLVGLLTLVSTRNPAYARIHELVASLLVAASATLLARVLPVSVPILTLSGVISLLPGLSLTVALTELATRHLASGTARAMGAAITFLQLGLGTSFGWKLADLLPKALRVTNTPLPWWAPWLVLPVVSLAFTVAFRARLRDFPAIAIVSALGYGAALQGQVWVGPELGAAVGGLVVGLASNLQARIRRVPTLVTQVPGLILLVPGSIGFAGFGALLDDDVQGGVRSAFKMMVVAGGLVAGMLAAGAILPPRRTL